MFSDRADRSARPLDLLVYCAVCAFVAAILVRTAWIADEGFVDFRTAANAATGYGLRWNTLERVETFSDPAWMLVLIAAARSVGNIPFSAVLLGGIFTIGTLLIVAREGESVMAAALGVMALGLSRSFVDYSVAGLPDPLGFLLLAAAVFAYHRAPRHARLLAVAAGLLPLVRAPLQILVAPLLLTTFAAVPRARRTEIVFLVAAPSIAWGTFSIFYFGLPLPAPFYAFWFQPWSIAAGLGDGARYFGDSLRRDPITIVITAAAIAYTVFTRSRRACPIAAGMAVYLSWVLVTGGSLQSGRLLAPAIVAASMLLVSEPWPDSRAIRAAIVAGAVLIGSLAPHPTFLSDARFGLNTAREPAEGIRDERLASYRNSGLLLAQRYEPYPDLRNTAQRAAGIAEHEAGVILTSQIGQFGYAAGPGVTIVDPKGRTDLLTARHVHHRDADIGDAPIVAGYLESLRHGTNEIADPSVAQEYAILAEVSRAPLFSGARLRAVWQLNVSTVAGLRSNRWRVGRQQAKQ